MVLTCEWGSYPHYFTGYEAHALNDDNETMLFIDERKTGNLKVICSINVFTIHTDCQGIIQLGYLPPNSAIHPQIQLDSLLIAGDFNPRSNKTKMNPFLKAYQHQYYENRLEKTGGIMALSSNTINWTTLPKETIRSDHQIGVIGLPLRWRTNKWIHNPAKSYKLLHDIIAGNDYSQKTYKIRKKTVLTKKKFHNFYTLSTLLGTPNGAREYHSRVSKRAEDFINLETASKVDKQTWLSQYRHQDGKIIIPARPFLVNNLLELKSGNSNAKDVDGLIYKIFANQLNKFMLINDRFHWNLVWIYSKIPRKYIQHQKLC